MHSSSALPACTGSELINCDCLARTLKSVISESARKSRFRNFDPLAAHFNWSKSKLALKARHQLSQLQAVSAQHLVRLKNRHLALKGRYKHSIDNTYRCRRPLTRDHFPTFRFQSSVISHPYHWGLKSPSSFFPPVSPSSSWGQFKRISII